MSEVRPVRYEEGETLVACSLCGGCRRYPSEVRVLSDRKFYCDYHEEYQTGRTRQDMEREIAANQRRRENDRSPALGAPIPTWRA